MIKKISIVSAIAIASTTLFWTPAAQADADTIAIIDEHFEPSLISGETVSVCVLSEFSCNFRSTPRTAAQWQSYNHGTIMADVVRQTNPNAKIILIKAAMVTSKVNGTNLNLALDWLVANGQAHGVDSISFSYNSGNGTTCRPAHNGNIHTMHETIVGKIATLKSQGINFYAASGNHSSVRIDYPACIQDVISVGSNLYRGSMQLSDIMISGFTFTSNALKSNSSKLQDASAIGTSGSFPVRVGHTTSVATAIAAANN